MLLILLIILQFLQCIGFNNYGSKMIAATKHNENELAHTFLKYKKIYSVFNGDGSCCHLFIVYKLMYSRT